MSKLLARPTDRIFLNDLFFYNLDMEEICLFFFQFLYALLSSRFFFAQWLARHSPTQQVRLM
ncbi:hypothetical protein Syun_030715 [Stephania yunnanensis]|uniref:Uncharacterized protein n=1 Tax=Stephania yunnanensis TaxID=152371 RepID=A0AAP0E395_9MAGN